MTIFTTLQLRQGRQEAANSLPA